MCSDVRYRSKAATSSILSWLLSLLSMICFCLKIKLSISYGKRNRSTFSLDDDILRDNNDNYEITMTMIIISIECWTYIYQIGPLIFGNESQLDDHNQFEVPDKKFINKMNIIERK